MARLRCIGSPFVAAETAPIYGPGTIYPLGGYDRATEYGAKQVDFLAALVYRVSKWRVQGTGTISGTSGDANFSGSFSFNQIIPSILNTFGSDNLPEKQIAVPFTGYDSLLLQLEGVGSWDESEGEGEFAWSESGDYLMQLHVNWPIPRSNPCSVTVGAMVYPMFVVQLDLVPSEDSRIPIHSFSASTQVPGTAFGSVSASIPDWRAGSGRVEWGASMAGPEALPDGATRHLTLEMSMVPVQCLPYGLDPEDPTLFTYTDRIWNDDGTANMNPLTAPRV